MIIKKNQQKSSLANILDEHNDFILALLHFVFIRVLFDVALSDVEQPAIGCQVLTIGDHQINIEDIFAEVLLIRVSDEYGHQV